MREFGQKKAAGAIILVLALAAFAFGLDLAIDKILYEKEDEIPEGLFLLEEGKDSDIFTDLTEGYRIEVPKGCSVDMRYSSVRALLEGEDANIEIYSQELSGDETAESYRNYSNSFLSAGFDNVVYDGEAECDFENASLLIWDRERLPGRTGARSHYASIDIPVYGETAEKADKNDDGETAEKTGKNDDEKETGKPGKNDDVKKAVKVYTIMIKSETPLTTDSAIIKMAENFSLLDEDEMTALTGSPEGAESYTAKTKAVDLKKRGFNDETKDFYEEYFGEDAGLKWGIFEPQTARFDFSRLDSYEEELDYDFPVIVNYTQVRRTPHPNLRERLDSAWERKHKVLELTLQIVPIEDGNMMYHLLQGECDDFLKDYAKVIADFGHPVIFRPFNEMNGDWCIYSAFHTSKDTDIYKEVYTYIYDIFEEAGANANTIWVWNPNSVSFPDFDWNHPLMYYPGDEYVDLVGMTAYNTGDYYTSVGEKWTEFADLYEDLYNRYLDWFSQPLMITEFASAGFGGDKAAWMESMFSQIYGYEKVKIAIWWDGCDWDVYGNVARDYYLDEDREAYDVFKKGIKGKIAPAVTIEEDGRVKSQKTYSTGLSDAEREKLLAEMAGYRIRAFRKGTTVQELLGKGNKNTRPDWLVLRKDGTYGYTPEKWNDLIKAGHTAGTITADEVKAGDKASKNESETPQQAAPPPQQEVPAPQPENEALPEAEEVQTPEKDAAGSPENPPESGENAEEVQEGTEDENVPADALEN